MIKRYRDFLLINEHHPGARPISVMLHEGVEKLIGEGFSISVIIEALSFYLEFYKSGRVTSFGWEDLMNFKIRTGISKDTPLNLAINSLRTKFQTAEDDWHDSNLIVVDTEKIINNLRSNI